MTIPYRIAIPLAAMLALAGCQTAAPEGPDEIMLDQAARAELGAADCQSYGGLRATRRLNDAADATFAKALQSGATEADIDAARLRARQQAEQYQTLYGNSGACDRLLQFPDGYTPPD
ncbi:hypothetical protein [Martelella soudanensis]|uniref:hypothetical protein n=1 Tax=unclassified Martelella TaxID=2629616 RepID=UPI0015DE03FD|nr:MULTISPECIES: hypothetical protein [unclassified Martelella]